MLFRSINADGEITNLNVQNSGLGYTTVPTVTVNTHVDGEGSGAVITAILQLDGSLEFIIENGGTGYEADANKVNASGNWGGDAATVTTGSTVLHDIDLGTGVRSIVE